MLAGPAPAQATFSVFPTVIDVKRQRDEAAIGTFNVRLKGDESARFSVDVQDAVQQSDGSFAVQKPTNSPFSASTWVSVSPKRFSGGPNRTQPIEYRALVPEKAEPGDHVTSLTVKRLPEKGKETAAPLQAVSVRLTVRVAGAVRPQAQITSLEVPRITDGDPVTVSAVVRNTGNVRLNFDRANKGSLAILSGSTRKADLRFSGTLYPNEERPFELSWDSAPLVGQFKGAASIDAGKKVVEDSRSVLVFPWKQIAALLLIALAVAILFLGRVRRQRYA